jgi:hypothetical protein
MEALAGSARPGAPDAHGRSSDLSLDVDQRRIVAVHTRPGRELGLAELGLAGRVRLTVFLAARKKLKSGEVRSMRT